MRHLKSNIFVLAVLLFESVVSYPPGFVDPNYFVPSPIDMFTPPIDYYLYQPFQRSAIPDFADELDEPGFQDIINVDEEVDAAQRALLYRPLKTQPDRFIIGDRPKAAPELGVIARFAEDPSDAVQLAARYQRDPVGAINFAATFALNPLRAIEIAAKFAANPLKSKKVADRFAVDPLGGLLIGLQFVEPENFPMYFTGNPSGNYEVLASFVHAPVKAMSIANAFDNDPVRTIKQVSSQSDDPLRILLLAKQFARNPSKAIAITDQYKIDPEGALQAMEMYGQRALSFDEPEDESDFEDGNAVRASYATDSMEKPRTRGLLSSIFGLNPREQADIDMKLAEAEAREEAIKGNRPKYSHKPIQNNYPASRPPAYRPPAYRPPAPAYGKRPPGVRKAEEGRILPRYTPPNPEF